LYVLVGYKEALCKPESQNFKNAKILLVKNPSFLLFVVFLLFRMMQHNANLVAVTALLIE